MMDSRLARRRIFRGIPLLAVALIIVAACEELTPPDRLPVCDESVELTVSGDSPVEFSWTPACRAFSLSVYGERTIWTVQLAGNGLVSPVQYGEAPAGAMVLGRAEPLRKGGSYTIELVVTRPPLAFDTVAVETFTP